MIFMLSPKGGCCSIADDLTSSIDVHALVHPRLSLVVPSMD